MLRLKAHPFIGMSLFGRNSILHPDFVRPSGLLLQPGLLLCPRLPTATFLKAAATAELPLCPRLPLRRPSLEGAILAIEGQLWRVGVF